MGDRQDAFFFDNCNGDQLTADDEGMELPDIEARK
jgi:hypothetical protein